MTQVSGNKVGISGSALGSVTGGLNPLNGGRLLKR